MPRVAALLELSRLMVADRGRRPYPSEGQQRHQFGIKWQLVRLRLALGERIIDQLSQLD